MKSNKQRRRELKEARRLRSQRQEHQVKPTIKPSSGAIAVNPSQLASSNSYTLPPDFYVDQPFTCRDCGKQEVWTAAQQQWWCEVAKGNILGTAIRCRPCRKMERDRKADARRIHLEGVQQKLLQQTQTTATN